MCIWVENGSATDIGLALLYVALGHLVSGDKGRVLFRGGERPTSPPPSSTQSFHFQKYSLPLRVNFGGKFCRDFFKASSYEADMPIFSVFL